MERQRIRDQIGALEEQLEQLRDISFSNGIFPVSKNSDFNFGEDLLLESAIQSLGALRGTLQEQSLEKSIPAREFLKKIVSILIREANANGSEVSVSIFGTGRISVDMVEVSMAAIMACLRASIKSFKSSSRSLREENYLFDTFSVYLEMRASPEEVHFRLTDDGRGYSGDFRAEFESEKHFQKMRTHISRFGGWFRRQSLRGYGGSIEFKIPLASGRFDCVTIKGNGFEFLLPSSCVAEIRHGEVLPKAVTNGALIAVLDENLGLRLEREDDVHAATVRVAVADFQFWIRCQSAGARVKTRSYPSDNLVDDQSWLRNFGIFYEKGTAKVLPLLEGEALMNFHLENGGADEGK